MAKFFRFRSIDSLLGKHRELEEQTIYFASPEELNDPMEGLRDIVWNGDKIVWTNFFKHYVFCLNRSYLLLNITREIVKLLDDVDSIPILERWDKIIIPIEKNLFDDIWDRFCDLPFMQEIIEALASTRRKVRYREIIFYLQTIQVCALLGEIRKSYVDHRLISEPKVFRQLPEDEVASLGMSQLLRTIKHIEKVENEHELDAVFQHFESDDDNIRLIQHKTYTRPSLPAAILEGTDLAVMHDFPKMYVEQLDKLLWSKWYTACFTGSSHNSSVWAKYADSHKGACMIFEAVEKGNSNSLELNQKTSNSSITLPFREVNYADRPGEIDFFGLFAERRCLHSGNFGILIKMGISLNVLHILDLIPVKPLGENVIGIISSVMLLSRPKIGRMSRNIDLF